MRLLRLLIYGSIALLILFFAIPIFLPDAIVLSQSIKILAKDKQVFRLVNDFENWKKWSPFQLNDPAVEARIEGASFGEGSVLRYNSHTAGKGSITITESEPYKSIRMRLDMKQGGMAVDHWQFEQQDDSVLVTWTLRLSELKYPFHRYFGFFSRSLMTPFQREGLERLAELALSMPTEPTIEFVDFESTHIIGTAFSTEDEMHDEVLREASKMVINHLTKIGQQGFDQLTAVYPNWSSLPPKVGLIGFQVPEETRESGPLQYLEIPSARAISCTVVGQSAQRGHAYAELMLFLREFGILTDSTMPVVEIYSPAFLVDDSLAKILRVFVFVDPNSKTE